MTLPIRLTERARTRAGCDVSLSHSAHAVTARPPLVAHHDARARAVAAPRTALTGICASAAPPRLTHSRPSAHRKTLARGRSSCERSATTTPSSGATSAASSARGSGARAPRTRTPGGAPDRAHRGLRRARDACEARRAACVMRAMRARETLRAPPGALPGLRGCARLTRVRGCCRCVGVGLRSSRRTPWTCCRCVARGSSGCANGGSLSTVR